MRQEYAAESTHKNKRTYIHTVRHTYMAGRVNVCCFCQSELLLLMLLFSARRICQALYVIAFVFITLSPHAINTNKQNASDLQN